MGSSSKDFCTQTGCYRKREHTFESIEKHTVDLTRIQCVDVTLFGAFRNVRATFVCNTDQLVALGYRDSRFELDFAKCMVHREPKETLQEFAFDGLLILFVLEVESQLVKLLENGGQVKFAT